MRPHSTRLFRTPVSSHKIPGRVEDWRGNPQDSSCLYPGFPPSCLGRVVRDSVSNPRHFTRSVRISRTTRSCALRIKIYGAFHAVATFD